MQNDQCLCVEAPLAVSWIQDKRKKIYVLILHPYASLSLATKILHKMEEENYSIKKYMVN